MELTQIQSFLIDGDGVLWRGDDPIPGLNAFFDALNQRGIKWALLTNNATRTRQMYIDKLAKFGIEAQPDQIVSSATATVSYLQDAYTEALFYVIGADPLVAMLHEAGFSASNGDTIDGAVQAVITGLDRKFNFEKLRTATQLIRGGAQFIATNPDRSFPGPDGLEPGAGAIVAAIEAATDVSAMVIGKPEPTMFEQAMKQIGADPATTAMIGDRLETDILGASRAGLATLLVLSGVTTRDQVDERNTKPDAIYDSIAEIAQALA